MTYKATFTDTFTGGHILDGMTVEGTVRFPTLAAANKWARVTHNRVIRKIEGGKALRIVLRIEREEV